MINETIWAVKPLSYPIARKQAFISWRTLVAFGLPFSLYLLTLAPTIYNLDSAEFTTAAATGGLVRATGYPLYLLLGNFWSQLPFGDVGYRMNLFSAFTGVMTIALLECILRRLRVGPWATFGALGLLAFSPYFWALSLIAEVYTLHTALMALVILLLLRWAERPTPYRLALAAFVTGLALGNHASTVLIAPACVWFGLTVAPRRAIAPRSLFLSVAGVLLGLSIYLYLPLRYSAAPAFNYVGFYLGNGEFIPRNLQTLEGLWWLVSGKSFAHVMLAYHGSALWGEVIHFGGELWRAFFAVGIGPGLIGIIVLMRRNWRLGGMLLLIFVCVAGFYIDYDVVDKDTMFLPAYIVWAVWLGIGYQWLFNWVRPTVWEDQFWSQMQTWLLRGVVVGAVALTVAWNWRLVDLSDDWSARARGEAILSQLPPNAIIFGWWDTIPVIEYLQLVEGQRPDVQAINRFLIAPWDMEALIRQEVAHRPVYIDVPSFQLIPLVIAEEEGLVYRLQPRENPWK
ncbi:MAG: DUF2723 domain-containing protein [Anaerolineae bacterium]